ncbi:MAG: transcription antitermination factor NusB [Dehalococcoidales bacterium]|nr:transcription antitermination factor NusB [Dehalococcoidales bacterium]
MTNERALHERIKARGVILQALYEIDCADHDVEDVLNHTLTALDFSDENKLFIKTIVRGIRKNIYAIDDEISKYAPAWPIDQIALVDRNILRIAAFEMLYQKDVPSGVIINEAVELAKAFGADNAPRFINGVLSSMNLAVKENEGNKNNG